MFKTEEVKVLEAKVAKLEIDNASWKSSVTLMNNETIVRKQSHELEITKLKHEHGLELKTKEFDMKHFKDNELKTALESVTEKDQKIAVLTKENEMLIKITDLNADVIDVKELVGALIKKLPEINLTSLTVNNGDSTKK